VASAVAVRLDSIRDRGGIKSREVAQLLDTTQQTVSRWRTGKVEPDSLMHDGLLLPSARSTNTNLVIFPTNRARDARFEILHAEPID
jgi:transcriptional regulator with XRE-family HTH domain